MSTFMANAQNTENAWCLVDAQGKTLGRLASLIAHRLRGKHRPEYTPHADTGDYVVVINAEKVCVTGDKLNQKTYYRHSGYPGGLKSIVLKDLLARKPQAVLEKAVQGMLPKGPLGRQMFRKLKVYTGPRHQHAAQQPVPLTDTK